MGHFVDILLEVRTRMDSLIKIGIFQISTHRQAKGGEGTRLKDCTLDQMAVWYFPPQSAGSKDQGCQMVYFLIKNTYLSKFWRALD
jgi:hypothetical protein